MSVSDNGSVNDSRGPWVRLGITPLLMCPVLFGAAGRLNWWAAWAFVAMVVAMQAHVIATLSRISPDLLQERRGMREGTKPWDKAIVPAIALLLPILMWVAAGLDVRATGSAPLGAEWQVAGFVLGVVSAWATGRAMAENRFFATTVRIQKERGHHVISTGPYAIVRHPGCVGMLGFTLATPLALGSRLALIPSAVCVVLLVVRTVLEDRTLHAELPGYAEYATRVRWRLVPGLW
jgi:protein-S-isoprenylcysteine O-methyltransferase Ste14